jgi:hypothetical protein
MSSAAVLCAGYVMHGYGDRKQSKMKNNSNRKAKSKEPV